MDPHQPHRRPGTRGRRVRAALGAAGLAALALALAACSAFPIPVSVDLQAKLGDSSSGSFTEPIKAGSNATLDTRYPSDSGQCIDFSDQQFSAKVERATLQYKGSVSYDGPALTGTVNVRLFAASSQGALWQPANQVGPTVHLDLDRGSSILAGAVVLNRDQLAALNARNLCWGLRVSGRDVSAAQDGTATVSYAVDRLMLQAGVGVMAAAR